LDIPATSDNGDIIACLPSIRALGRGRITCFWKPEGSRENLRGDRFDALAPLLQSQPYVSEVTWTDAIPKTTHDFSTFRHNYRVHENLAVQQARHIGVEISLEPWLSVPNPIETGVAVIARSSRYHNSQFPWRKILNAYSDKIFVGLQQEWKEFQATFGEIPYHETKDLLELARVIAGASVVVSNQTCAWWIAVGLGVTTIQESFLSDLNSVIERPNLVYSRNPSEINLLLDNLK
jgi:hypothetical protein